MITRFFGDGERGFALTAILILELERTTGKAIGTLCRDLIASKFSLAEITETIRLAMIGGGTAPAAADALVKAYIPARPLIEAHILATDILSDLWFGSPSNTEQNVNPNG